MDRIVTALFDNPSAARRALRTLIDDGIASERASGVDRRPARDAGGAGILDWGYVQALFDLMLPDADRSVYEEGLRRGHHLLWARVAEKDVERAVATIEAQDPIDLDRSERDWRGSGWAGPAHPATQPGAEASAGLTGGTAAAATGTGPGSLNNTASGLTPGRATSPGATTGARASAGMSTGFGMTQAEALPGMGQLGADDAVAAPEGPAGARRGAEIAAETNARAKRTDVTDRESPMGEVTTDPAATAFEGTTSDVTSNRATIDSRTRMGGRGGLTEAEVAARMAPNPVQTPELSDAAPLLQRSLTDRAGRVRTYVRR